MISRLLGFDAVPAFVLFQDGKRYDDTLGKMSLGFASVVRVIVFCKCRYHNECCLGQNHNLSPHRFYSLSRFRFSLREMEWLSYIRKDCFDNVRRMILFQPFPS